jgi:hypothetical protein
MDDTRIPLISFLGQGIGVSAFHESVYVAHQMTFEHNGIIWVLNSKYQHCLQVSQPADIMDLLKYTQFCWVEGAEPLEYAQIFDITTDELGFGLQ